MKKELKEISFNKAEEKVQLVYKIDNEEYFASMDYKSGVMEYLYNKHKGNLTDDFAMFNEVNKNREKIENTEEFERNILEGLDLFELDLDDRYIKKTVIRCKREHLYLDVYYTYSYKVDNGVRRRKNSKITHDITGASLENIKLMAVYATEFNYHDVNSFIDEFVKFKRGAYSRFMEGYGSLIYPENKDEEEKHTNKEDKNMIGKIAFFKYNEGESTIVKAVIFFKDGSYKTVNEREANIYIDILSKVLEKDRDTLVRDGYIEDKVLDEKDFVSNIEKYRDEAVGRSTKSENRKKKVVKSKKRKVSKVKIAGLVAGIVALAGASIFAGSKHFFKNHKKDDPDNKSTTTANKKSGNSKNVSSKEKEIDEKEAIDYSNYTWNQLVDMCRSNEVRVGWMSKIKEYLTHYNEVLANSYCEKKQDAKLAHSFNEAESYLLACRKADYERIHDYFGNKKIDSKDLMKNLKKYIKQEAMFHNIQTSSSSKTSYLLKGDSIKQRYTDYEDKFVYMNNTSNVDEKIRCMSDAYDMIRKDLKEMKQGTYENVDSCVAVMVTEFAGSLKNIKGVTVNNSFTEEEQEYIANLLDEVVAKRFKKIETKNNARVQSDNLFNDAYSDLFGEKDLAPSYQDMCTKITEKLQEDGAYNIENRDITAYKAYKENTKLEMELVGANTNDNSMSSSDESQNTYTDDSTRDNSDTKEQTIENTADENQKQTTNEVSQEKGEDEISEKIEKGVQKTKEVTEKVNEKVKDGLKKLGNKAKELKEKAQKKLEQEKKERDKKKQEEEEKARKEEQERLEAEKRAKEEQERLEAEQRAKEEERRLVEENNSKQVDLPVYSEADIEEVAPAITSGSAIDNTNNTEAIITENSNDIASRDLVNKDYLSSIVDQYVEALANNQNNEEEEHISYRI